jgi:hypothetical protein
MFSIGNVLSEVFRILQSRLASLDYKITPAREGYTVCSRQVSRDGSC